MLCATNSPQQGGAYDDYLTKPFDNEQMLLVVERALELVRPTEQAEREIILATLKETNWNRTAAAAKLKISRKTLFNKMRQYRIEQ